MTNTISSIKNYNTNYSNRCKRGAIFPVKTATIGRKREGKYVRAGVILYGVPLARRAIAELVATLRKMSSYIGSSSVSVRRL